MNIQTSHQLEITSEKYFEEVFWKSILKIQFYFVLEILFEKYFTLLFSNYFQKVFHLVLSKYFWKVFCTTLHNTHDTTRYSIFQDSTIFKAI